MLPNSLAFQLLSTVQNSEMGGAQTIASAAVISPVSFLTKITGTVQIATITPPIDGIHMLAFVFSDGSPGTFLTSGNILNAVVPTQNVPTLVIYDPIQKKYYGWANNLT